MNQQQKTNPRYIPLEGGHNFRHIGGYPVANGGITRPGLIYRSGRLSSLTDADRATLDALGIRTAFDLRSEYEYGAEGAGSTNHTINIVHMPTSLGISAIREQLERDPDAFRLGDFYKSSLTNRIEYHAQLFRAILGALDHPMIIHCSAGKDRTGIIIALLLRLAGVDDNDIVADYAETALYAKAYNEVQRAKFRDLGMTEPIIKEMLSSPPERIVQFLEFLDAEYQSADNYFMQGGVTAAELDAFRNRFVIESEEG